MLWIRIDPDADQDSTSRPDADSDADPDSDFYLMQMWIRMRIQVTKIADLCGSGCDSGSTTLNRGNNKLCQEFLEAYLGVPGDLFDRLEMVDHYQRARRGVRQRS